MQNQCKQPLFGPRNMEKISMSLSNLMMTGEATPFLHNGTLQSDDSDIELVGIQDRNPIGFLIWERSVERTDRHNLGSRMKTPHLPMWVTCVNNKWGVLFHPKMDLMKSHAAENRYKRDLIRNSINKVV